MHETPWAIIIPVKRLALGKSRLRDAPADDEMVLAVALDTVAAAATADAVDRIVVVTADPVVAGAVRSHRVEVVPDSPDAGLNAALRLGAAHVGVVAPRAALLADLPALRGAELSAALSQAVGTPGRAYVADRAGTGTTLLAALAGIALDPRFGPGSATAHASSGAVALAGDWPTLRLDVDTATDLIGARALGLGRHTTAALERADAGRPAAIPT